MKGGLDGNGPGCGTGTLYNHPVGTWYANAYDVSGSGNKQVGRCTYTNEAAPNCGMRAGGPGSNCYETVAQCNFDQPICSGSQMVSS